jgi:hypothetical protein
MSSLADRKKHLFRKQQLEWIKIGGIWGLIIPGLAFIDFMYRNPIFYTLYVVFCFFAVKLTMKIRRHLFKLAADYQLVQHLEALDESIQVLPQVKVETGKKEAEIEWVLVSSQGVWCLKVNVLAGKIVGGENEKDWSQILKPKKPKSKSLVFPNPALEVKYEAKRLKEYLRQRLKLDLAIEHAVVFTKASFCIMFK